MKHLLQARKFLKKNITVTLLFLAHITFLNSSNAIASSQKSESLKIMTLNTWMIPFLREQATERSTLIGMYSRSYDLVLLQEVFNVTERGQITKALNGEVGFTRNYEPAPFLKFNSGLVNFSKYKVVHTSFKQFSDCAGQQCIMAKGVLHSRIELPSGTQVDVFNTHLQAFKNSTKIREAQMNEVLAHIKKVNNGERVAILVGDLNISAKRQEYKDVANRLCDEGFSDAWTELNGNDEGLTWNSYVNKWAAEGIDKNGKSTHRFDYIFVRSGDSETVELKSSKVIFDKPLSKRVSSKKYFLSDHFGVELNFNIIKR